MLKTMVAFIKKRIKKSTISAINLCAKDGMTYSLPVEKEKGQGRGTHRFKNTSPKMQGQSKVKVQLN